MKYVILDANFILSCVRKKIDFFNEIKYMGFSIIIPTPVIKEIEKISKSKQKLHFREDALLSLEILKTHDFKKTGLDGKTVDYGIIKLANENGNYIVATLDREIKNKVNGQKLIIRGDKRLELTP